MKINLFLIHFFTSIIFLLVILTPHKYPSFTCTATSVCPDPRAKCKTSLRRSERKKRRNCFVAWKCLQSQRSIRERERERWFSLILPLVRLTVQVVFSSNTYKVQYSEISYPPPKKKPRLGPKSCQRAIGVFDLVLEFEVLEPRLV